VGWHWAKRWAHNALRGPSGVPWTHGKVRPQIPFQIRRPRQALHRVRRTHNIPCPRKWEPRRALATCDPVWQVDLIPSPPANLPPPFPSPREPRRDQFPSSYGQGPPRLGLMKPLHPVMPGVSVRGGVGFWGCAPPSPYDPCPFPHPYRHCFQGRSSSDPSPYSCHLWLLEIPKNSILPPWGSSFAWGDPSPNLPPLGPFQPALFACQSGLPLP